MKTKKTTIRKKMSMREYVNLINFFETGELEMNLDACDPAALSKIEVRVMRLSADEKIKMDEFFANKPFGISAKSIYDSIPKIKGIAPAVASAVCQNIAAPINTPATPIKKPDITSFDANKFDYMGLVQDVEQGKITPDEVIVMLDSNYGSASKILSIPAPYDIRSMRDDYSDCAEMYMVIQRAEIIAQKIKRILDEPDPSDSDIMERFVKHVLYAHEAAINKDTAQFASECDSIDGVDNDKIIFCAELEKFVEYTNATDMKHDVLYLIKRRKLDIDADINVFGKSINGNKIIAQLYKKFPNGIPGGGEFYKSNKEAYLLGALKI